MAEQGFPGNQTSHMNPRSKAGEYMAILSKKDQNAKLRNDLKLLIENIKLTNVIFI